MEKKQKTITVNGLSLWTENFGDAGDPVCLLVCGAGAPAKFWSDTFCLYIAEKGYFVIRYDHRDQGMSSSIDFNTDPYTVEDLAKDAIGILDVYKISKSHVVGHSMGGIIVQLLAIHYPERILSMTSMCVSTVGEGKAPPREVMDILLQNKPTQNFDADLPNFMRSWEILNGDAKIDKEMAIAYTKDFYERSQASVGIAWNHIRCQESLGDITEDLLKLSVSVLFIAGEKDVMVPPERVETNSKFLSGAKFIMISKMGHMFFNRTIEKQIGDMILHHLTKKKIICRKYGNSSFAVALIHGGPGGGGEVAPVAKKLSNSYGVLEPLQTEDSLEGQIQELRKTLQQCTDEPVTLIGYSWGALLSYIVTVRYPEMVNKLILVGCPPLEEKDSDGIMATRLSRLVEKEKRTFKSVWEQLKDPNLHEKEVILMNFIKLLSKTDGYDASLPDEFPLFDPHIFSKVWSEAKKMRKDGELLKIRKNINCPLIVIHGSYDPHPFESVKSAFDGFVEKCKFILLDKCGHTPWLEHYARDEFYKIIEKELSGDK